MCSSDLYEYCRKGYLDSHLPNIIKDYRVKRDAMEESFRKQVVPRAFFSSASPESLSLAAGFDRMALRTASSASPWALSAIILNLISEGVPFRPSVYPGETTGSASSQIPQTGSLKAPSP